MSTSDQAGMTKKGVTEAHGSLVTQINFPTTWAGGRDPYQVAKEYAAMWRRHRDGQVWYREPNITQDTYQMDDRYHGYYVTVPIVSLIRPVPGPLEGFERMHFTQSNNFSVLDVLYHSSTGWALANGGSTGTEGEVLVSAVNGQDFVAVTHGFVEVGSTFSAGDALWLSTAGDGSLTATEPTAAPKTRVGKCLDSGTVLVSIERLTST